MTEGVLGATVGGGGSADVDGSPKPNVITDNYGTVGGGAGNQAGNNDTMPDNADSATVGGGYANSASAGNATVAGGRYNRATASRTTVAGGWNNLASGDAATVGGGKDNTASSSVNTIGGGQGNSTSYGRTTIGGGQGNVAAGDSSTIGGGRENTTDGIAATIPGGWQNAAMGNYSFAAGRRAKAEHPGAFVWADSADADFQSTGSNQFLIRASGGVGIGTPDPAAELDVAGTVKMTGFKLSTGAMNGRVLACDSSGTGSWQPDGVALPFAESVWSSEWAFKAANTYFSSGTIYGALAKSKKGVHGYVNLDDGEIGGIGVEGEAYSDTAAVGVKGEATGAWAKGVYGYAHGGGQSIGVHGQSNDPEGIGVYAIGVGDLAIGIKAQGGMWGYAAVLEGATSTHELEITGGSDISERFDVRTDQEDQSVIPGMVVSIDPAHPGDLIVSSKAYDRRVAGVISGAGGVKPGVVMGQTGSIADGEHPVALSGRVYVWANASSGMIQPGDLLTTSDTPGHAMIVTDRDRAHGAIVGKAMTSLESGRGLVLVLVNLQ